MREVDDAVRQDDLATFGQKYGKPLLALVIVIIAAFGFYLYWQGQREAEMERQSETLVTALDQLDAGNFGAASERLQPIIAEGGAPAALALMLQAGAAAEDGNSRRAAQLFGQVAENPDAPAELRDLARVREVAVAYDSLEPAEVIARLEGLAQPGNAFFGSAGELVAMAHLDAGNRERAGTLFSQIARDETVPESIQSRARQMAGLLGVDTIDNVNQIVREVGGAPTGTDAGAAARPN